MLYFLCIAIEILIVNELLIEEVYNQGGQLQLADVSAFSRVKRRKECSRSD